MNAGQYVGTATRWCVAGVTFGVACYATYVGTTWLRYGHIRPSATDADADPLLDRFMPTYEVVERHRIRVAASADITLAAASEIDLRQSPIIHTIFKGRELLLGSTPDETTRPRGFLALTKSLGWGVLAEMPGREIVMGAVTQPWEANVVFRAVPPEAFADFNEPGYVKIVWTLRADALSDRESIFRTETRAVATELSARRRFRRYWSFMSPGIILIRHATLGPLRADAERRAREVRSQPRAVAGGM